MPKATWGTGISEEMIDNAQDSFAPYSGPLPPKGVYRFTIKSAKKGVASSSGNPKLTMLLILDGSWRKEHKRFDGYPIFDHMPVTETTLFRVKALCSALGITSADFLNKMVVDDEGNVVKIGNKVFKDKTIIVYANTVKEVGNDENPDRLKLSGGGYMPKPDDEEDDSDHDTSANADGDSEDPWKAETKAADKAAKKAAKKAGGKKEKKGKDPEPEDSEPPF